MAAYLLCKFKISVW